MSQISVQGAGSVLWLCTVSVPGVNWGKISFHISCLAVTPCFSLQSVLSNLWEFIPLAGAGWLTSGICTALTSQEGVFSFGTRWVPDGAREHPLAAAAAASWPFKSVLLPGTLMLIHWSSPQLPAALHKTPFGVLTGSYWLCIFLQDGKFKMLEAKTKCSLCAQDL